MAFQKNPSLKEADAKDLTLVKELEDKAVQKVDASIPIDGIEKRLDLIMESPFWDRVHEGCIGCRVCTYLCPTCHCFDLCDEVSGQAGERIRVWDTCQFPLFTKHASGHNPRKNKKERLRQRFMHKFSYAVENTGVALCVGCGRCIAGCPVNLDIRDVIRSLASPTKEAIQ
jgi:ferredoxin